MNQNNKFYKGWHHFYLGLLLELVSFYLLFHVVVWVGCVVFLIGLIMILDDFYQHWRQESDINYHSPLHRLYANFKKPTWMAKLNVFIDRIFGRK